ncbi:MAG: hypothetical protein ABSA11_03920 [Candidatus Bathyarchaeia archaeon]|jgi:hypothetical protein
MGGATAYPEDLVEKATNRFVRDNGEFPSNYGYAYWILDNLRNVPNDASMIQGNNANDCYVIPSLDLVVVRQGNENGNSESRPRFRESVIEKIVEAIPKK